MAVMPTLHRASMQVDKVTPKHLQQHFVDFARNDNLGVISTWLLAQADAQGPDSPDCQKLAALHSTAVDFPKTGRPAQLNIDLVRGVVCCLRVPATSCKSYASEAGKPA